MGGERSFFFLSRELLLILGTLIVSLFVYQFFSPLWGAYGVYAVLWIGILRSCVGLIKEVRSGRVGVDVIAVLAMFSAAIFHQLAAGTVILLMLVGGETLERYASARAGRHLTDLISGVPVTAHRKKGRSWSDILVDQVEMDDILLVKPGEVVPVDGIVVDGSSVVDESRLTGESLSVDKNPHDRVLGGSVNQGQALEIRATTRAEAGQYQRLVRLVQMAQTERAPFVRLADRYSFGFTLFTLVIAGCAWVMSHDTGRVLSVFVVATPCPLILATPIAILSGIARAAKQGVIVRTGRALEALSRVDACVFDKTGTLTYGTPTIVGVEAYMDGVDVLRVAASLDQGSTHILARSLVEFARKNGKALVFPKKFHEVIGKGVDGSIENTGYLFGRASFLEEKGYHFSHEIRVRADRRKYHGQRTVFLGSKKHVIGAVIFSDTLRPGLKEMFAEMKRSGIRKIVMLTGDKQVIAERLARAIGIRSVQGDCLPEDKMKSLKRLQKTYHVAMIGDGVNDAPALAAADVGIAMGANGSGAASEAADIVMMRDQVSLVLEARMLAQRTIRHAQRGILFGMGMSVCLMIVALFGYIPPVEGAILQEMVDVVVIVYALKKG